MTAPGWLLIALRGTVLILFLILGLILHSLIRLIEWPLAGRNRPVSPLITRFVCRNALRIMGIGYSTKGQPMRQKGAVVANHAGWMDIFALNAGQSIYFVAKAEVATWPGIGLLAKVTGTVFITRKSSEARRQQTVFEDRLRAGHQLLFFPEGTSTDSQQVLPFKSTLFQAFYTHGLDRVLHIQPVTVVWHAPVNRDPSFYGWWGDMDFASHLLKVLAVWRQGRVEVIWHPEVPVDAFASRKELALYCERVIRTAHPVARFSETEQD
ncbi:1-acyl-sn-glycerol-3-phosphate acyltransferase [Xinfangfangia sp. D13-10-4-6]|nr:1-acyl-sn-glycerol-3-phosphate acyltransferase [Pseudogemmobacter hezensis]